MSDKEAGMPAQSSKAPAKPETAAESTPAPVTTPETAPEATPAPDRPGEEYRREWADANGVDPSEMHTLRYPGGWVDRFDGNGWVQEGGY